MTVYVLHFLEPFGHARHYTGWSQDVALRLHHHANGTGANLPRRHRMAGGTWLVGRLEVGAGRARETQLKRRRDTSRSLCLLCAARDRRMHTTVWGWLGPRDGPGECQSRECSRLAAYTRSWGRGVRRICPVHASLYVAGGGCSRASLLAALEPRSRWPSHGPTSGIDSTVQGEPTGNEEPWPTPEEMRASGW